MGDPAVSPGLMAAAAFVDARLALHLLDSGTIPATVATAVEQAFRSFPSRGGCRTPAPAELSWQSRPATTTPSGTSSSPSPRTLVGRSTAARQMPPDPGPAVLTEAAARFERIGARFEHAHTLRLLSHR